MLAPIVLAAGGSTRMGSPKALLLDGEGRTFVARIARTFAEAGFEQLTVVTGSSHELVVRALDVDAPPIAIQFARNGQPGRGQLSSIWAGMDAAVTADVEAIVLTLVDIPFTAATTVRTLVAAYRATPAPIVRPAAGERHGHPVIFDRSVFHDLRRADPAVGAKAVVRRFAAGVLNVAVRDEGAFADIDTPADYQAAVRLNRTGFLGGLIP